MWGSSTVFNGDDDAPGLDIARGRGPTGVRERGARTRGHPETWETSLLSPETREANPLTNTGRDVGCATITSEDTHQR